MAMAADGQYVEGSYYFYAPNKGAAIFFTTAFLTSGLIHAFQCYPLLELQNYHILGRILYYVPYHSPLHPGRVISTFAFLSAIVEALNGWGASYSANQSLTDAQTAAGHALIKTSLILQLAIIAAFIFLAAVFHRRCAREGLTRNRRLRVPLATLYTSVGLICVRTIYRVVEYFGLAMFKVGSTDVDPMSLSPVIRYEWFFYVFEAALMLVNVVMFNALHPMRFLPRSNKVYLARDGETEVRGPGWRDKRPFLVTVIDPFNLAAVFNGKKAKNFWEDDGVVSGRGEGQIGIGEGAKTQAV